jgi:hypothetical protein
MFCDGAGTVDGLELIVSGRIVDGIHNGIGTIDSVIISIGLFVDGTNGSCCILNGVIVGTITVGGTVGLTLLLVVGVRLLV